MKNPFLKRDRLCHDKCTALYNMGFVQRCMDFDTTERAKAVRSEVVAAASTMAIMISMGRGGKGLITVQAGFQAASQLII